MKVTTVNGLRVITDYNKKYKNSIFTVSFATPLGKENTTYNKLLARVLASGCEKYKTKQEISLALKKMYGASMSCSSQKCGYALSPMISMDVLSDEYSESGLLSQAFEFCREILFRPLIKDGAFDKDTVEREKERLAADILSEINDKRQYAKSRCMEIACGDDPYGASSAGDEKICRAITEKSLYEHYKYVINNCGAQISIVGNYDEKIAEKEISELASKLGKAEICRGGRIEEGNLGVFKEECEITQGKLVMAYTVDCDLYDDSNVIAVFNALFGGGVSSKLFNIVREKMSLCYYASSAPDKYKSLITVQAGIDFDKFEKTVEAINAQLNDIQNGVFTDDEFTNAAKGLVNGLKESEDDIYVMSAYYAGKVCDSEIFTPAQRAEMLNSVTREQITEISKLVKPKAVYFLCAKEESGK